MFFNAVSALLKIFVFFIFTRCVQKEDRKNAIIYGIMLLAFR